VAPDRKYLYGSSAWQTTLVDLLALLLCFIALQYALGLPNTPSISSNATNKRHVDSSAARNWFIQQNIPQVMIDHPGAQTMHLTGKLESVPANALNQLKCAFHIVQPPMADLMPAQSLLKKLRSEGLSIPSGAGIDSRTEKLTMIIDLGNCQ
jgi:hypothetical protein